MATKKKVSPISGKPKKGTGLMSDSGVRKVVRDSKTGRIVDKAEAKRRPATTQTETVGTRARASARELFTLPRKPVVPKNLAEAADMYHSVREARLALAKSVEPYQQFEGQLREYIIENLPKSKAGGIAGKIVRVEIVKKEVPQIKDEKKFEAFARKKGNEDLLVTRANAKAIGERWEAGKKIPGVEPFIVVSLSMHKLK
jgi:hypothetical protein